MEFPRFDPLTKLMAVMTLIWIFMALFSIQSKSVHSLLFWYTVLGVLPWTLLVLRAFIKYFGRRAPRR